MDGTYSRRGIGRRPLTVPCINLESWSERLGRVVTSTRVGTSRRVYRGFKPLPKKTPRPAALSHGDTMCRGCGCFEMRMSSTEPWLPVATRWCTRTLMQKSHSGTSHLPPPRPRQFSVMGTAILGSGCGPRWMLIYWVELKRLIKCMGG